MGDSFTAGDGSPSGYRYFLFEKLYSSGAVFEMIGANKSRDYRLTESYSRHCGVGGDIIGTDSDYQWTGSSWVATEGGSIKSLHFRLFAKTGGPGSNTDSAYGPYVDEADIIVLFIGLNDYYNKRNLPTVGDRYRAILDEIYRRNPDVSVYCCTLPNQATGPGQLNEQIKTDNYNDYKAAGRKIAVVDLNASEYKIVAGEDTPSDDGHPNEKGNNKIATAIFKAMVDEVHAMNAAGSKADYNPVKITSLSISKTSATLKVKENLTLTAKVSPENVEIPFVLWSSSNEKVAVVDSYGRITAVAAGKAKITAKTLDGRYARNCIVTVLPDTYEFVPDFSSYSNVFIDDFTTKNNWTGSTSNINTTHKKFEQAWASEKAVLTSKNTYNLGNDFMISFNFATSGAELSNSDNYGSIRVGKYELRVAGGAKYVQFVYDNTVKKTFESLPICMVRDTYTLIKSGKNVSVYRNNELLFTVEMDSDESVNSNIVLTNNCTWAKGQIRSVVVKSKSGTN